MSLLFRYMYCWCILRASHQVWSCYIDTLVTIIGIIRLVSNNFFKSLKLTFPHLLTSHLQVSCRDKRTKHQYSGSSNGHQGPMPLKFCVMTLNLRKVNVSRMSTLLKLHATKFDNIGQTFSLGNWCIHTLEWTRLCPHVALVITQKGVLWDLWPHIWNSTCFHITRASLHGVVRCLTARSRSREIQV